MGCDHAQGYAISRPLPGDDFDAWLRTWPASYARVFGNEPALTAVG